MDALKTNSNCKIESNRTYPQNGRNDHRFGKTTEIVAQRIVKKQFEYGRIGKTRRKTPLNIPETPGIDVKINNVVVNRILNIQMKEFSGENVNQIKRQGFECGGSTSTSTNSDSFLPTRHRELPKYPANFNIQTLESFKGNSYGSTASTKFATAPNKSGKYRKSFELPKFKLAIKTERSRYNVVNKAIQATLNDYCRSNFGVQTKQIDLVKMTDVQTDIQPNLAAKKLQTRLFKTIDEETDPELSHFASKSTSTPCNFYFAPYTDRCTQFFDYMSDSEVFCLDWIKKYVFPIKLNPFSIVVDRKMRDVSELGTKSTLFSDTLCSFQRQAEEPCCRLCP